MNLNRNRRWENFDVDCSLEICEFFESLVAELEQLTPPGPRPGGKVVEDVFSRALEAATCGDVWTAQATEEERLGRLGYTREEVDDRVARSGGWHQEGAIALEDQYREATISSALEGNAKARETVAGWIRDQKK